MVRKWSYINQSKLKIVNTSNISLSDNSLIEKFKFKIFKKNTKFTKYNTKFTKFIRKNLYLRKRRLGWKPYFLLSSIWVKFIIKNKKLINYIQSQMIYKYTITYTHFSMFLKKSNQLNLIGMGMYGLNYTKINTSTYKIVNTNIYNKTPLIPSVQFTTKNCIEKLSNLGFSFLNYSYINNYYPIKLKTKLKNYPVNNLYINNNINNTLNISSSLKTLHSYLVLLNIFKIKI